MTRPELFPVAPVQVYRCYDRAGRLLYIGMTGGDSRAVKRRLQQHRRESPWHNQVAHVETETVYGRNAAAERERTLIVQLQPPHNYLHTKRAPFRDAAEHARAVQAGLWPRRADVQKAAAS